MDTGMLQRFEAVQQRIAAACARAGRPVESVRLLPVSKTFGPEDVRAAAGCGLKIFGESRVQEARQKIGLCPAHLEWHMIGHVQTNKVREVVRLFRMVHAVDSVRLLEAIDRAAAEAGVTLPVCLEINVSGERSKFGLDPAALPAVLDAANRCFRVHVVGLMTIPPAAKDVEESRPFFRRLRELRDTCERERGLSLPELSMGMSDDFEVAIEEGATWVRVGTLLFGERRKPPRGESGGEEGP